MTKLETLKKIDALSDAIGKLDITSAHVTIKASTDNILRLLAVELKCHVYEPYEFMDNECRYIAYRDERHPNIIIRVESLEMFTKEIVLKPY